MSTPSYAGSIKSVLTSLTLVTHAVEGRVDQALKPLAVTWRQARALLVISATPGINRAQLARRLDVTPQAAGTLAHRLADLGLIRWLPTESGSPVAYRVTSAGWGRAVQAVRVIRTAELEALRMLSTELCSSLLGALRTVECSNARDQLCDRCSSTPESGR